MTEDQVPKTQVEIVGDDLSPMEIMRQTVPNDLLEKLKAGDN